MKRCPYCAEQIQDEAIKCRFCGSMLVGTDLPPPPGAVAPNAEDEATQFTHSGSRYLLGYGRDFFGIWDRQGGRGPVSRYPRTDDGWRAAWLTFTSWEPESAEVGMGGATPASSGPSWPSRVAAPRRVSGAWWLLPILAGWLGGLIAWLVNRDVDPPRARAMLLTGIAVTVVLLILYASVPANA